MATEDHAAADADTEAGEDDVVIALMYLRRTFPFAYHSTYSEPALLLISQLYALVDDRTLVDRRIRELIDQRRIVQFDLPAAGVNERAVMFTDEYRDVIRALTSRTAAPPTKRLRTDDADAAAATVLATFVDVVLPTLAATTITDGALAAAFASDARTSAVSVETVCGALIGTGVLVRHRTAGTYYIAVPHSGHIVRDLVSGRRSIAAIIRRRRFGEMSVDQLNTINGGRIANSERGAKWTVLDMIGTRRLTLTRTDRAQIVRLSAASSQRHR